MHNNIMAVGSRDHPPMLATRRYAQWQSRIMRYVDTKPNSDSLRKCILQERANGVVDFKRLRQDFQNDDVMDLATASRRS
ncbi:hypothetical protein Tco_1281942 [Tanacetum coccineum]